MVEATCLRRWLPAVVAVLGLLALVGSPDCSVFAAVLQEPAGDEDLAIVARIEQQRSTAIRAVIGSVVAIYDQGRQGGGSGVVIDPSGLALTNHHVIMGAGVSGMAGLADGKLYPWELIATDPGGDLALIRLKNASPFPASRLGNSDRVRVGDWALAMGNPFVLAEDHVPTVTLGIVSGVRRYQEGAGLNQLVYGNCIQVDSSINPGNSGGPLFDLAGLIIGINGRASFLERGRVNVGLGYAISSNQSRNFLGDLMATFLAQHGTLDASFSDYTDRGILCSSINEYSDAAKAGLELADRLLELEGVPVETANEVASLMCTLPRGWPTTLRIQKPDGTEKTVTVRLSGLPYQQPQEPPPVPETPGQEDDAEKKRQEENQLAMARLLSATPSTVRDVAANHFCRDVVWQRMAGDGADIPTGILELEWEAPVTSDGDQAGATKKVVLSVGGEGDFLLQTETAEGVRVFQGREKTLVSWESNEWMSGNSGLQQAAPDDADSLDSGDIRREPHLLAALAFVAANHPQDAWFPQFGTASIDGSDQADGQVAIRLKSLDADQDWFYAWVSTDFWSCESSHAQSHNPCRLLKVAPDLDSDGRSGGLVFRDWQTVGGWQVPASIRLVRGITEEVVGQWNVRPVTGKAGVGDE